MLSVPVATACLCTCSRCGNGLAFLCIVVLESTVGKGDIEDTSATCRHYHSAGARIHIGRLATQYKEIDQRVIAGKDYAMVWLRDAQQRRQPVKVPGKMPLQLPISWQAIAAAGKSSVQEPREVIPQGLSSSTAIESAGAEDHPTPASFPKVSASGVCWAQ